MNLLVKKRDGKIVDYNRDKIIRAILAGEIASDSIAANIANDITALVTESGFITVEEVQDNIEHLLMVYDQYKAAKHFILYRTERSNLRAVRLKPDTQAISDYIHYSKYSRYREDWGRRETWGESIDRNCDMHVRRWPELRDEIESIYSLYIDTKRVLPSMRSVQFGGAAIEANHARMFNCSFTLIDRPRVFAELFFLLLSGCGVGYSVQFQHVERLPSITKIDTKVIKYHSIEDSIEGWSVALELLINSYMSGPHCNIYIEYDYSFIRAEGTPLKTSGGLAPGHIPLKKMLEIVRGMLDKAVGRQLKPIECHDICCIIAEAVLSGGIRRSSLIAFFSPTDSEMMMCKTGDWYKYHQYRQMSNNSVIFLRNSVEEKPFKSIFKYIKEFGEPGFFLTNDLNWGANPCAEIGLDPIDTITGETGFAFCNLTEINGAKVESEEDFYECAKAATFIGTLQAAYTDFPYLTLASSNIATRDALLGVSITGVMDSQIVRNPGYQRVAVDYCNYLNVELAERLGINSAARITTIKPSGTASLLLGCVGSGHHPHHAKRYVRRITANKIEKTLEYFRSINPHMVVEKPNGDFVIEFPIEAPSDAIVNGDLTAIEFMEEVFSTYENWIKPGTIREDLTHNVSCTVVVKEDEWEAVANHAWDNRHRIASMSFLPETGDKIYPYAPREAIVTVADEARYNELIAKYVPVDWTKMLEDSDGTAPNQVGACEGNLCELPRRD